VEGSYIKEPSTDEEAYQKKEYTRTEDQVVDVFTKTLRCAKFDMLQASHIDGVKNNIKEKRVLRGSAKNKNHHPLYK